MRKAIIITGISKYLFVIISFVITMILSRLLTPQEFGIVAVVSVFLNFFVLMGDFGIGASVIQNKKLTNNEIETLHFFTFLFGVAMGLLFILLSLVLEYIYQETALFYLGLILSFSVYFSIRLIVPQAILSRNQNFKGIGISTIIAGLISGVIGITLAFQNFSYFSLAFQALSNSLILFVLIRRLSNVKFKIAKPSEIINVIKKIKEYSSYQLGFNIINYFARNLDNLLIGKILGAATLGSYNIAYKLVLMPIQNLTSVISPVLHPILSNDQNNISIIYYQFRRVSQILSTIGFFISLIFIINSNELIIILFGQQWEDSIKVFEYLSYSIGFQILMSASGSIFQATNNTKLLFRTGSLSALTIFIAIISGVIIGDVSVLAALLSGAYAINFIQTFYFLIVLGMKESIVPFIRSIAGPLTIWAIIVIIYKMYLSAVFETSVLYLNILINSLFLTIIYLIGIYFTKDLVATFNIIFPRKIGEK